MSALSTSDVDALLREISPDAPCGENLEYDPRFLSLELEIKGKPEVQYGDSMTPATPPEWKTVKQLSLALFAESHDLRIALPLSHALLKMHGLPGFADGLALIDQLLATQWSHLHPQLDPDDDNDPMSRINTLAVLTEAATILRDIREATLVSSRINGRFSLREIDIATGELEAPPGEEKPALSSIDAAFQDADGAEIVKMHEALTAACGHLASIEAVLTEQVGVGRALDLSAPAKMLKRARDFVGERIRRRADLVSQDDATVEGGSSAGTDAAAGAPAVRSGEINGRDDVVKALEKICQYYERNEPGSPVPLLLERAKGLVTMSFVELMQNLAPDGLTQLYQVSGKKD